MSSSPSLEDYIAYLNNRALKLDHRNNTCVLPRGLVLTVQCDKGITRLGVATGLGGIMEHTLPKGIVFKCSVINKKKTRSFFQSVKSLFSRE